KGSVRFDRETGSSLPSSRFKSAPGAPITGTTAAAEASRGRFELVAEKDRRGRSWSEGLASRVATALETGSAESFLVAEAESLAGVRSAALLPGSSSNGAPRGAIVLPLGEPPLARLAVVAGGGAA